MEESPSVTYDRSADTLYVTYHDEPAVKADETKDGTVCRWAGDGRLVGVTIMDFAERLRRSR